MIQEREYFTTEGTETLRYTEKGKRYGEEEEEEGEGEGLM
jgi:hypothetical protein